MVSRKVIAVIIVVAIFASSIAVLSQIEVGTFGDNGKVKVVATFYPLYYFASQIAGDRATVEMLIPDNVEPHSWGPTASDMISVSKADMFVYNGAGFEPWASDFIDILPSDAVVVDTSVNVGLTLSEEIEALYVEADGYLAAGPYTNVSTIGLVSSLSIPKAVASPGTYNLTLVSGAGSYGGVMKLNVTESGDYRLFFDSGVNVEMQLENGSFVTPEAEIGTISGHGSFLNAVFLEFPIGDVAISISNSTTGQVHMVLVKAQADGGAHAHGLNDPHFWIDPLSAKVQVNNILAGLIKADPTNSTFYKANAQLLSERLDKLHLDFLNGLADRTKNDIITTHEGFNYLASRYGFKDHAAIGISGDAQPSAQDLARLSDLVSDLGLHYVFSEPIFNDAVINQIASVTGAEVLVLDGAHGRTGIHRGMDYFEIMYSNLEALKIGLEVA